GSGRETALVVAGVRARRVRRLAEHVGHREVKRQIQPRQQPRRQQRRQVKRQQQQVPHTEGARVGIEGRDCDSVAQASCFYRIARARATFRPLDAGALASRTARNHRANKRYYSADGASAGAAPSIWRRRTRERATTSETLSTCTFSSAP